MKRLAIILMTVMLLSVAWANNPVQWKDSSRDIPSSQITETKIDGVDVYGKDGVIVVRTPRKIRIRVLTILGQTVSDATLNPGTSELRINSRGIYIVKIGDYTKKVAL
ncbi:MAG: hypothetical protein HUK12_07395 [Muribaculaceae bacterium]|nr:hypothetical protein [Muribaculaceae bacterium]